MLSQETAANEVRKLRPENHSFTEDVTGADRVSIQLAYIAPLVLIHLLLTAPYMSPAAAYTLLSAKTAAWNWDDPLAPLMKWLRASLYHPFPGVTSLPPLDMADHITVGQQTLQRKLVLRIPTGLATPALTYIVQQAQQVAQATPANKKSPAER